MPKYRLSQGQGLAFGPYLVIALTGGELVAMFVPEPITVVRPAHGTGTRVVLEPRQSLLIGQRRFVSDSERWQELEVLGCSEEVIGVDHSAYPKPPSRLQTE